MSKCFNYVKSVIKVVFKCLFLIVLFTITVICLKYFMVEIDATKSNQYLMENYAKNEELNYYYDHNEDLDFHQALQTSIDSLPEHLRPIINEWNILLSNHQPFVIRTAEAASGITYLDKKVIWISHDSDAKVIVHEFGHVIDSYLGSINATDEFKQLYEEYWSTYIEYGQDMIDIHSISCPSEFFAATFADYILFPEYLKENSEGLFIYFEKTLSNSWRFSSIGQFVGISHNITYTLNVFFDNEYPGANLDSYVINKENPLVNINDYSTRNDYSWMHETPRFIVDEMMGILDNPDKYIKSNYLGNEGYIYVYNYQWEPMWYEELHSYASIYFLDESPDMLCLYTDDNVTTIVINHDELFSAEYKREDSMREVEKVISTQIHEGTETEKLIQIVDWMRHTTLYRNAESTQHVFWHRKTGDCVTYAMIFKQFCDRLNIACDIVYIQDASTNGRLYNRVTLQDGSQKFYDVGEQIVDSDNIYNQGYYLNLFLPISDGTKKHVGGINLYK